MTLAQSTEQVGLGFRASPKRRPRSGHPPVGPVRVGADSHRAEQLGPRRPVCLDRPRPRSGLRPPR
eukprot:7575430-Lingulodinium_polyedra.AAC.1